MTLAKTVYGICFAAFIAVIAVVPFTYEIADAKSNNMSVKMSPEMTRQKKGGGKIESAPRDAATGQASGKRSHDPLGKLR